MSVLEVNDRLSALGFDALTVVPELTVAATAVLLLGLRLVPAFDRLHLGRVALPACLVALAAAAGPWFGVIPPTPAAGAAIFDGLLAFDPAAAWVRLVVLTATTLTVLLTLTTGIPDTEDSADFYTLLMGGTLGMLLMASAQHLLLAYLAVEMASLPSYALTGFLKGRRTAGEASLKYVVFGGSASGLMLYGMSLLVGVNGGGSFAVLGTTSPGSDPVALFGWVCVSAGLGFKLAAVPFHVWCPDVFEGAPAEVAGFLSVASKAAALGLTLRLVGSLPSPAEAGPVLAVFAGVTATVGNLAAFGQTNLPRLLAYSTIAHAGYMLMGVATTDAAGRAAVLFYLPAYLLMNLGAFAAVAALRNRAGTVELPALAGIAARAPWTVAALGVCLVGLLGLPPLAGFAAKFQVFAALYDAGQSSPRGGLYLTLLGVAGLNTVLSAYYYLGVLHTLVLREPPTDVADGRPARGATALAVVLAAGTLAAGVAWGPLAESAARAAGAIP
jgi:NADH-quinone oxidoreductase subunit N